MRTLLLTALLIALPGAARAEAAAPPVPAEKPAQAERGEKAEKARRAKGSGAKADAKAKDGAKDGKRAQGQPDEGAARVPPRSEGKPCEPVKPCPID